MLSINDSLNPKEINGKKCRSPEFYKALFFCVLFTVAIAAVLIVLLPLAENSKGLVAIMLLIAYFTCFSVPLYCCISDRHIVCILGDDKFYFFLCQVTKFKGSNRKSQDVGACNGTVYYTDIQDITFKRKRFFRYSVRHLSPSSVTIHGEDFEITVPAFKSMVKKLKIRQDILPNNFDVPKHKEYSNDLWGDIVEAFDNGKFDTLWNSNTIVDLCQNNFQANAIDISIRVDRKEICFNIDNSSIYVYYPEIDEASTTPLADFNSIEDLFAYIKSCEEKEI